MKFASLFSGAGGADVGAQMAGLDHLWGIENNPKAASIAHLNNLNIEVSDVCKAQWAKLDRPDWLHASPPCQNASVANVNQGEERSDIRLAQSIRSAIAYYEPTYFSLENVTGYSKFKSFALIQTYLLRNGYTVVVKTLDSAAYGVAQNRKRLWLVASKGAYPRLPWATHGENSDQYDLFGALRPFVGWKEAIADAGPLFLDGWSDRLEKALPKGNLPESLVAGFKDVSTRPLTIRAACQCAPTLLASMNRPSLLPWVVSRSAGRVKALCLDVPHLSALQGFPDSFIWGDDLPAARKAIGNAVSPPVMSAIAQAQVSGQALTNSPA